MGVQQEILRNILIACQYHKIKCIIGSYAFYAYDQKEVTLKMQEGIEKENKLLAELAKEFAIPFVDQNTMIPKKDQYFLDWVHFTPEGMRILAENFGVEILRELG